VLSGAGLSRKCCSAVSEAAPRRDTEVRSRPPVYGPTYHITIACPRRDPLTPPEVHRGLLRRIIAVLRNLRQHGTLRHPDSRYWD
jgi:hypothetical protein